ncbi:uncharacterized protein [Euwallacea fornicatus]|uniref:uncharacterized protein isoform X1 n=2 Tax=Euwallacea fornicatus TaxID=995702 RepID=UPI00338D8FE5
MEIIVLEKRRVLKMRVAIIGCGAAGLSSIKQCLDEGIECEAFEQGSKVGGTWNYYDHIDEANILSQHSSMYQGLVTNLPKELMELDGFPYKEQKSSFISQRNVIEYLDDYAKHFGLLSHIKFDHKVEFVDPRQDNKWTINTRNLKNNKLITNIFDGVIVCNGHYYEPIIPSIEGMNYFKDKSSHSHYIKKPDKFKNMKVLVLGGGPSGVDFARIVSQVADKVYFSFRKDEAFGRHSSDKSITKPEVSQIKESTVLFADGSEEEVEFIIYCTGFATTFPFLSKRCKIEVDENWVYPLYKHIINIEHPSMAIISIATRVCPFPLFAIQVRFYLAFLKGLCLISKEEMYDDLLKDRKQRDELGVPKKLAHEIGFFQLEYCQDLENVAQIRGVPPVIGLMFKYHLKKKGRRYNYRVLNDEEFEAFPIPEA